MLVIPFFLHFISFLAAAAKPVSEYGVQPIHFEQNSDQQFTQFDYIARSGRYGLMVSSREARFVAGNGQHAVTMRLEGARKVAPSAAEKLPGVSHYYMGPKEKDWRTNVTHYSRVRWAQVYEGIDVVYYAQGREVEFDFVVAPGADVGKIRLSFDGAWQMRLTEAGSLELGTPDGMLTKRPPVAYQMIGGKRRPVEVRYALVNREVSFQLGRFDKRHALTIDPSVAYATYLGGEGADVPTSLAVDGNGSAYVTGNTNSAFFPGAGLRPTAGDVGFVTKLTPAGNGIVYSIYVQATPGAIAVDAAGAVYLSGHSSGGLAVKNAVQPQLAGGADAFVAKFDPSGGLVFATYLGGSGEENGQVHGGVRVDTSGAVYVAGWTKSSNFPVRNAAQAVHGGGQDAFVAKLDPSGNPLVFATYLGGSADEFPGGLAVDAARNPILVGRTLSDNFPTRNASQTSNAGRGDAFLTRLHSSGSEWIYSTYHGGDGFDSLSSVAAEPDGSVAVVGMFASHSLSLPLGWFVCRYSASNQFSTLYHSPRAGLSTITLDPFGNLVVSGSLLLEFGYPTGGTVIVDPVRYRPSGDDALLLHLRPNGQVMFSTFWGGYTGAPGIPSLQYSVGAVADSSGGLYLAGVTTATDIYTTGNAVQPAHAGGLETFLVKFVPGASQVISSVRIGSDYGIVPVIVDGKAHTGTRAFQWLPGNTHRIEAPEKFETASSRHTFKQWLHGGPREQTITVGNVDGFYQAQYTNEIKVETQVIPSGAGSIEISPRSTDGYYVGGTQLTFRARAASGFRFTTWGGAFSGFELQRSLQISWVTGPFRVTASFSQETGAVPGMSFVPVTPCRIMDTRPEYGFASPFGAPALEGGSTREVAVPLSKCGIPAWAGAYALNITAVPQEPLGYLTAFPTGQSLPGTSTLNASDGVITANAALVKAGTSGSISLFASNRTHVIVDISGYFTESPDRTLYSMFTGGCRALDTRLTTSLAARQARSINVVSACFSPQEVSAAWVIVTAYPKGPLGWVSLTSGPPTVSTLNSPRGEVRTNAAIVPLTGNSFSIQASDETDVTVDVMMFFTPIVPLFRYHPVTPCRVLDTRGQDAPQLTANLTREMALAGRCGLPGNAVGYVVNATLIPSSGLTSFQLWSPLVPPQSLPMLQAAQGRATANALVTPVSINGGLMMQANADTHVILDISGYFAP